MLGIIKQANQQVVLNSDDSKFLVAGGVTRYTNYVSKEDISGIPGENFPQVDEVMYIANNIHFKCDGLLNAPINLRQDITENDVEIRDIIFSVPDVTGQYRKVDRGIYIHRDEKEAEDVRDFSELASEDFYIRILSFVNLILNDAEVRKRSLEVGNNVCIKHQRDEKYDRVVIYGNVHYFTTEIADCPIDRALLPENYRIDDRSVRFEHTMETSQDLLKAWRVHIDGIGQNYNQWLYRYTSEDKRLWRNLLAIRQLNAISMEFSNSIVIAPGIILPVLTVAEAAAMSGTLPALQGFFADIFAKNAKELVAYRKGNIDTIMDDTFENCDMWSVYLRGVFRNWLERSDSAYMAEGTLKHLHDNAPYAEQPIRKCDIYIAAREFLRVLHLDDGTALAGQIDSAEQKIYGETMLVREAKAIKKRRQAALELNMLYYASMLTSAPLALYGFKMMYCSGADIASNKYDLIMTSILGVMFATSQLNKEASIIVRHVLFILASFIGGASFGWSTVLQGFERDMLKNAFQRFQRRFVDSHGLNRRVVAFFWQMSIFPVSTFAFCVAMTAAFKGRNLTRSMQLRMQNKFANSTSRTKGAMLLLQCGVSAFCVKQFYSGAVPKMESALRNVVREQYRSMALLMHFGNKNNNAIERGLFVADMIVRAVNKISLMYRVAKICKDIKDKNLQVVHDDVMNVAQFALSRVIISKAFSSTSPVVPLIAEFLLVGVPDLAVLMWDVRPQLYIARSI